MSSASFFQCRGASTTAGNRRSATWAIGVSIYYLLAAIPVLVVTWGDRRPIGFQPKGPVRDEHPSCWTAAPPMSENWSAVNIKPLVRARLSQAS